MGDLLTPDDKGRLAQNFKGYDISPDMVRLSLVNLYLHGFTDPHIAEYDTLTSQDKWNEHADVTRDLRDAIGQYNLYRDILTETDPARILFMAIDEKIYEQLFVEKYGQFVIKKQQLNLIVFDAELRLPKQFSDFN